MHFRSGGTAGHPSSLCNKKRNKATKWTKVSLRLLLRGTDGWELKLEFSGSM